MSASERLRSAATAFREIEARLRRLRRGVEESELEAVVVDIDEALSGLAGAELGRALVFKAHVLWWQHFLRLTGSKSQENDETTDPRVQKGIVCAMEGRALLRRHPDGT